MCVRRRSDELGTVPPKGNRMRTATAASVEPAGREEMSGVATFEALVRGRAVNPAAVEPSGREDVSGVACLKLWSARALLSLPSKNE